jgi:MraZ protein
MFLGEYRHAIDERGRLAIPVKLRKALGDGAVITRGSDRCLVVYPHPEWERFAGKLADLPLSDSRARSFTRLTLAGAMEVPFDAQGRALIPGYLRSFAEIRETVVITGVYNRVELWAESAWDEYTASHTVDENLSEFGV